MFFYFILMLESRGGRVDKDKYREETHCPFVAKNVFTEIIVVSVLPWSNMATCSYAYI